MLDCKVEKTRPPLAKSPEERQFIDPRDYLSEESSDQGTQEIDPMDELSDFEPQRVAANGRHEDAEDEDVDMDDGVEAPVDDEGEVASKIIQDDEEPTPMEQEEEQPTACAVCGSSENEAETLLCDGCDGGMQSAWIIWRWSLV